MKELLNTLQGHRVTKTRKEILELFYFGEPLSAADLIKKLALKKLFPNKTTVYRELDFLLEQGIIQAVDFGDGVKRFESSLIPHHHHLICTNCRSVSDIIIKNNLCQEEKRIARLTNFQAVSHSLEFFGLCRNCQKI